jgi:membrane protein YdbS with pleckstrin-like domain
MSETTDLAPGPAIATPSTDTHGDGWQPLPLRARTCFCVTAAVRAAVFTVIALVAIGLLAPADMKTLAAIAALLLLPTAFIWAARRKYRHTQWRLDGDGFAVRRGRFWQVETRVPGSRVQHLDIVRGPVERRFDLSTLVIHTAGTRNSAVSLGGLDATEAERLRDTLALGTGSDDDT